LDDSTTRRVSFVDDVNDDDESTTSAFGRARVDRTPKASIATPSRDGD